MDIQEEIRKAMKEFKNVPDAAGLNYDDLCIYLNLDSSQRLKIPKFDIFGGVGNPMAHLRAYCD